MILIRGEARGTSLTGTLYEPDDEPPEYDGAPDTDAPYVWVCDSFYEVESGGTVQVLGDDEVRVAFESPAPRGFEERAVALNAAEEHLRTQFARLGVGRGEVELSHVNP